jgi:glycosyltransferase involved in cell wall biosynthesis
MNIVIACNYPRDEKLGTARVPLRLADGVRALGVEVATIFAQDLPHVRGARADQLTAPLRMAATLLRQAAHADVVDIAGFDAWAYARAARRLRPRQAVVSRSNGLWRRALIANGDIQRDGLRDLASRGYQSLLRGWERASMVACDLVLFGASSDADEIVRLGWKPRDAVAVVAPGVDDFFASAVPLSERRDVAWVGTFFHRKGNDIVAAAMSTVLLSRPALGLTLFAPGVPAPQVLAQFDERVRAQITIVEAVPSTELARRLGHFATLVFPTRYEGFGLVVLEAMRAGLAVVTTPTGAGSDVVRDGENGLLVPLEDVAATAAAVARLCDQPELRMRLGAEAVAEAQRRPWSRTARELLSAYQHALALAAARA